MKLQIKMGTEEAEAFKNFMGELRPQHVAEEDFIRTIFYKGVEKFQEELMEQMQQYMEDNKDSIDASALEAMGHDASSAPEPEASKIVSDATLRTPANVEVIED